MPDVHDDLGSRRAMASVGAVGREDNGCSQIEETSAKTILVSYSYSSWTPLLRPIIQRLLQENDRFPTALQEPVQDAEGAILEIRAAVDNNRIRSLGNQPPGGRQQARH